MERVKISPENVLLNLYFLLMDAADIVICKAIRVCEQRTGNTMSGKHKMHHNRMMQGMKSIKHNYEATFMEHQQQSFGGNWRQWDDMRREANYLIRIALLMSDRTLDDTTKEQRIEQYIETMPTNSLIDQDLIDYFRLK